MGDKVRGTIAIVVGVFALWQSYESYEAHRVDGRMWLEVVAGLLLIGIGIWRFRRKPEDLTSDLLKDSRER
jgi:ABC-type nickel/cobalt efflux system permease component RcnA